MIRNGSEYIKSLRDGRSIYYRGTKVDDVITHPVLSIPISHAKSFFDFREDKELRKFLTFNDSKLGEISGFYKIPKNSDDLWYRSRLIQETTRLSSGIFNIIPVSYTHLPSPRDLSTSRMPSSA